MIQAVWSLDRTPTRGRAVLCEPFHAAFPSVPLPLYVEALGAVIALVLDGRCAFAVAGSVPTLPPSLAREPLRSVGMGMVASPLHLLASYGGPIPSEVLAEYVQLVFTDRTTLSKDWEFGVLSSKTWRLADLGAKRAFLRSGLGWGGFRAKRSPEIELTASDDVNCWPMRFGLMPAA